MALARQGTRTIRVDGVSYRWTVGRTAETVGIIAVHAAQPGQRLMSWVGHGAPAPTTALALCPCCDYHTLPRRGDHEICPVCLWEDDGLDLERVDVHSGPNHLTLREARQNFAEIGACEPSATDRVLPASARSRYARRVRSLP